MDRICNRGLISSQVWEGECLEEMTSLVTFLCMQVSWFMIYRYMVQDMLYLDEFDKNGVVAWFSSNWCRSKMFAQLLAYIPCYQSMSLVVVRTARVPRFFCSGGVSTHYDEFMKFLVGKHLNHRYHQPVFQGSKLKTPCSQTGAGNSTGGKCRGSMGKSPAHPVWLQGSPYKHGLWTRLATPWTFARGVATAVGRELSTWWAGARGRVRGSKGFEGMWLNLMMFSWLAKYDHVS